MTALSPLCFGRAYWITSPRFDDEKTGAGHLLDWLGHGKFVADNTHQYSFVFTDQEERQVDASCQAEELARKQLANAQRAAEAAKTAHEANRGEATFSRYRQVSRQLGEAMAGQRQAEDACLRTVLHCARQAIHVQFDPLENRFSLPPQPDLSELEGVLSPAKQTSMRVH